MTTTRTPDATDNAERQARAQLASIVRMVVALEVDYDRLEELREQAKAGHYLVGTNMPGYMPDNPPLAFDDADDARDYLASLLDEQAEAIEDRSDHMCQAGACKRGDFTAVDAIAKDCRDGAEHLRERVHTGEAADIAGTIGGTHYSLTYMPGLTDPAEQEELDELEAAAGDCESTDDAEERINEDPLEVQVRGGWYSPGDNPGYPEEFYILLCTGGPAVRLVGDMPVDRVRIEYQDWGTGWTELYGIDQADRYAMGAYAQRFLDY